MTMKLSRRIPARTMTITASWCKREFMRMSPTYRAIRSKTRNPMDKCHWCEHPFEDGEMMALACFGGKGNKTLCQACANELIASDDHHSQSPMEGQ